MPLVHVHLCAGRTPAQKKAVLDGVHAALVEAFRIPEQDRFQILHEHAPEHFEARYGEGTVLVEASVFPGRSVEAKRTLYRAMVRNLEAGAGVPKDRVFIVLHEPAIENWGIRGGQAACDVKLGFRVDV